MGRNNVKLMMCEMNWTLRHHLGDDHEVDRLGEEDGDAVADLLPRLMGHPEVEDTEAVDEHRGHNDIHDEVGGSPRELQGEDEAAELVLVRLQRGVAVPAVHGREVGHVEGGARLEERQVCRAGVFGHDVYLRGHVRPRTHFERAFLEHTHNPW